MTAKIKITMSIRSLCLIHVTCLTIFFKRLTISVNLVGELSFFLSSILFFFFLKQCFCCAPPSYTKFTCGELQNAHQPMFGHIQAPVQTHVYFGLIIQSTLLTEIHWCRSEYHLCTRKAAAHCSSGEDVWRNTENKFYCTLPCVCDQ